MHNTLPDILIKPLVEKALREDLGRCGDITSMACIPADAQGEAFLNTRQAGVIAGLSTARMAFSLLEPTIKFATQVNDGDWVEAGQCLASITGSVQSILSAERTALNFLSHLSGVATATHQAVRLVADMHTKISCTRKTVPGLRGLQKYAVRMGGGVNHRMGLDDAILIKDNHIVFAGGIAPAVERARAIGGRFVPLEVEVDTLAQLEAALALNVEMVLLDNMTLDELRQAVALARGRAMTEASGGVTLEKIPAIAASGVDFIAIGALTHSVRILDIGLDHQPR